MLLLAWPNVTLSHTSWNLRWEGLWELKYAELACVSSGSEQSLQDGRAVAAGGVQALHPRAGRRSRSASPSAGGESGIPRRLPGRTVSFSSPWTGGQRLKCQRAWRGTFVACGRGRGRDRRDRVEQASHAARAHGAEPYSVRWRRVSETRSMIQATRLCPPSPCRVRGPDDVPGDRFDRREIDSDMGRSAETADPGPRTGWCLAIRSRRTGRPRPRPCAV